MSTRSDIVLNSREIDVEGDTVGIRPVSGDRRIVLDPRSSTIAARSEDGNDRVVADGKNGNLTLLADTAERASTIQLRGGLGYGEFGGGGTSGKIDVVDGDRGTAIQLDGTRASVETYAPGSDDSTVTVDGRYATVTIGKGTAETPQPGTLEVNHGGDRTTVRIDGERPRQYFYRNGSPSIALDGSRAAIDLGSDDVAGKVDLVSTPTASGGRSRIRLDTQGATLRMEKESGAGTTDRTVRLSDEGELALGGTGGGSVAGEIRMTGASGDTRVQVLSGSDAGIENSSVGDSVRVYVDGRSGETVLGGNGRAGRFEVRDADGRGEAVLTYGSMSLGAGDPEAPGHPGEVSVKSQEGLVVGRLRGYDATLEVGGAPGGGKKSSTSSVQGVAGTVALVDSDGTTVGTLEASQGSISVRDATGTEAMRIEGGVVKTAQPVQRI